MSETQEIKQLAEVDLAGVSTVSGKVPPPRKRTNAESGRTREHLTEAEVEKLLKAARTTGRNPIRDEALVLIAFRHGLRVNELVALTWHQVHLDTKLLDVTRLKNGTDSTHPMEPDEVKLLKKLAAERESDADPVFVSEQSGSMTDSNVRKLVARLGKAAGLPFPVHPHQLRHACGYAKVNAEWEIRHLQQWMGHRNIQHTVHYAQLSDEPFRQYFGRARKHK